MYAKMVSKTHDEQLTTMLNQQARINELVEESEMFREFFDSYTILKN